MWFIRRKNGGDSIKGDQRNGRTSVRSKTLTLDARGVIRLVIEGPFKKRFKPVVSSNMCFQTSTCYLSLISLFHFYFNTKIEMSVYLDALN